MHKYKMGGKTGLSVFLSLEQRDIPIKVLEKTKNKNINPRGLSLEAGMDQGLAGMQQEAGSDPRDLVFTRFAPNI